MAELHLVRGNKNFSSWSLRAWLSLRFCSASFTEEVVWFDEDGDRAQRRNHAPTGRVPVLYVDGHAVWDSLAIAETLHELYPEAGLWPSERAARARARSIVCEMHSGFGALRTHLPLHCRGRKPARDRGPEVAADVARIQTMWAETRAAFGADGPYLFGQRSLADAFYAPVASRFLTYSVPCEGAAGELMQALLAIPEVVEWMSDAEAEGHEVAEYANNP